MLAHSFVEPNDLFGPPILKALEFAALAHKGQNRKGGLQVPYFSHPAAVGLILARAGFSDAVVIAGVLHDVVEDTPVTVEELTMHFGKEVASIVLAVSENKTLLYEERKAEYMQRVRVGSVEVKAVSSADQIANMTNLIMLYAAGEDIFKTVHTRHNIESLLNMFEQKYEAVAVGFDHTLVKSHREVLDKLTGLLRVQ